MFYTDINWTSNIYNNICATQDVHDLLRQILF